MLVEILSRQNIKGSTLEEAQKASGPALDALWRTHWIKDSVMKKDVALLAPLKDFADEIAESSDCVVITAGRQEALAIRAALAAVPAEEGRPEVIVCEPTFSPSWYGDLFEKLEGRRCVQLAVTAGAEDLLLRCAYATVKRFIFENGRNVPGNVLESEEHSRVYAVCGRGSTVIAQDAQENDYPVISLDDTVDPMYLANTAAVLLPVLIRGGDGAAFLEGFTALCIDLARSMAADGEGAKHLITCQIKGAKTVEQAEIIGKSVIGSSLTKAAIFGCDANWGRVLAAMGYSGEDFDPEQVDVAFASAAGRVEVCKDGRGLAFDEDLAKTVLTEKEVVIDVTMREGDASATCWGCDLTYDYVRINGDYRT